MKAHAIMISLPAQGHLNPFVDLAMKLASRGITVTLVLTEHAHLKIASSLDPAGAGEVDIFAEARASGLDIRAVTVFDGFPLDYDRDLNVVEYWGSLIRDFPALVSEFVGGLIAASDPSLPAFLVADTFAPWHSVVAEEHNLVNVSFFTQPAAVFAIDYYRQLLSENGHYPPKGNEEHVISYLPGVTPISTKDLMSHLQETGPTTLVHKIVLNGFKHIAKADFILHNTIQELEPQTLSILNKTQPTYAVGPIKFSTKTPVPKSYLREADCSKWLESKPPNSVLYVSFGSITPTSREVIHEIARGLLLSRVEYFVWALRPRTVSSVEDDDLLPVGFGDEVGDRGLVVPWCDQLSVLSHEAVGGFLTHCGWNSTLESMWCGVPMICHPLSYDQPTNRKLVVDDWKVGINLCDQESVDGGEVAEKVRKLMVRGEASEGIREMMKEVRSKVCSAWSEDGSSQRNFNRFINDLNHKILCK